MEIELPGMAELEARLEALGPAVARAGARKAVRAGGKVIRAAMEEVAPVLDRKTAQSTALEPGSLKAGMRVYVPADEDPAVAVVGPSSKVAHVARWVEYGHRQVKGGYSIVTATGTRGPGKAGADVPAHPFLRPAFEASVAEGVAAMEASLAETIQEATR